MPPIETIVAELTVVVLLITIFGFILGKVKSYKDSALKEVGREVEQNSRITALEGSIEEELEKVKALETKLGDLRDSLHNKDIQLSELKTIIELLKDAQLGIESDIKELISIVGRG